MTEEEVIDAAFAAVGAEPGDLAVMRRSGRILLALPPGSVGARYVLDLYQPQRPKAVLAAGVLRILAIWGLHRFFLPRLRHHGGAVALDPPIDSCEPGTAGVLLGSPEHRVRRAILTYETPKGREVAKLAFGAAGREVLDAEAAALAAMPGDAVGIPIARGVHHGAEISMLRLPHFEGVSPTPRRGMCGMDLLEPWVRDLPERPAGEFPEWPAIRQALETHGEGKRALVQLADLQLCPVIRHGDFARWNLLQCRDGALVAIDWEWGHPAGMPGIDLVHLFAQDARLVHKLPPKEAVGATLHGLGNSRCRSYLERVGWGRADPLLMIIACLAWKQGAGHQENDTILNEAVGLWVERTGAGRAGKGGAS